MTNLKRIIVTFMLTTRKGSRFLHLAQMAALAVIATLLGALCPLSALAHEPHQTPKPRRRTSTDISPGTTTTGDVPPGTPKLPSLPLGDAKLRCGQLKTYMGKPNGCLKLEDPEAGYIYSCTKVFHGVGAVDDVPWIFGSIWYPDLKIHVQGDVDKYEKDAKFSASKLATLPIRVVRTNGLPHHHTGTFPIAPGDPNVDGDPAEDPAYKWDQNPHSIAKYDNDLVFWLPYEPGPPDLSSHYCLGLGAIGVTLTGVPLFNGLDAVGRDADAHELQDLCDGHPQDTDSYHYHGYSPCMIEENKGDDGSSGLVGYALDGYGIYGPLGPGGKPITNVDLDECHGRTSRVFWNGKFQDVYHYNLTYEYPYSIGCFRGTPVISQIPPP